MNLKCYKSVIPAPTSLLILNKRLKILPQAAICTACGKIRVRSRFLSGQGLLGEFPSLFEQIAAPLLIGLQLGDARLALGFSLTAFLG
jgi:hypothetical protein